jgi:type I restriction enzyme M protein
LGRAGIVCPQGVLFRGQPEMEEETGEFDGDGDPVIKRRKADDEYLIRKALLESRLIDAVISLPLNVFYGAGVPACLLILSSSVRKTILSDPPI